MFRPFTDDERYTISKEFCGHPKARWVARFCGDWIGQDQYRSGAVMLCVAHYDKRQEELGS